MSGEQVAVNHKADDSARGLYLGGIPPQALHLMNIPVTNGMTGCISSLQVSQSCCLSSNITWRSPAKNMCLVVNRNSLDRVCPWNCWKTLSLFQGHGSWYYNYYYGMPLHAVCQLDLFNVKLYFQISLSTLVALAPTYLVVTLDGWACKRNLMWLQKFKNQFFQTIMKTK